MPNRALVADAGRIFLEERPLHAQRLKNPLARKLRERLSADPLDDLSQEKVIAAAVLIGRSRPKRQRLLVEQQAEKVRLAIRKLLRRVLPAHQNGHRDLIPNTALA